MVKARGQGVFDEANHFDGWEESQLQFKRRFVWLSEEANDSRLES